MESVDGKSTASRPFPPFGAPNYTVSRAISVSALVFFGLCRRSFSSVILDIVTLNGHGLFFLYNYLDGLSLSRLNLHLNFVIYFDSDLSILS